MNGIDLTPTPVNRNPSNGLSHMIEKRKEKGHETCLSVGSTVIESSIQRLFCD